MPVGNRAEADPGPCSVWICLVVRHIYRAGRQFYLLPLLAPLDPGQGQKGVHEARGVALEWELSGLARELAFQLGFEDRVKILSEK